MRSTHVNLHVPSYISNYTIPSLIIPSLIIPSLITNAGTNIENYPDQKIWGWGENTQLSLHVELPTTDILLIRIIFEYLLDKYPDIRSSSTCKFYTLASTALGKQVERVRLYRG